jgi:hypothetical protein
MSYFQAQRVVFTEKGNAALPAFSAQTPTRRYVVELNRERRFMARIRSMEQTCRKSWACRRLRICHFELQVPMFTAGRRNFRLT